MITVFQTIDRAISHLQLLTADTKELPNDCHFQLRDILSHIKQVEEANIIQLCCLKSCVKSEGAFASILKGLHAISVDFMIYCGKLSRKIPKEEKTAVKFYVSEEAMEKLGKYVHCSVRIFKALEVRSRLGIQI